MTKAAAGEQWCSQHHQARSQCRPEDRHVWSVRAGDGLMGRVEAKAKAMGLDRNGGVEAALEAWADIPPVTRGRKTVPAAADPGLAATVADLAAQVEEIRERMSPSVTPSPVPFRPAAVKR